MAKAKVPSTKSEWEELSALFDNTKDDRALVILGGSVVEAVLSDVVASWVLPPDGPKPRGWSFLSQFFRTIEIAQALGLIDDEERRVLDELAGIRNVFAHELLTATFENPRVREHFGRLRQLVVVAVPTGSTAQSDRDFFRGVVSKITLRLSLLVHEPLSVAKFRARMRRRIHSDLKAAVTRRRRRRQAGRGDS